MLGCKIYTLVPPLQSMSERNFEVQQTAYDSNGSELFTAETQTTLSFAYWQC